MLSFFPTIIIHLKTSAGLELERYKEVESTLTTWSSRQKKNNLVSSVILFLQRAKSNVKFAKKVSKNCKKNNLFLSGEVERFIGNTSIVDNFKILVKDENFLLLGAT